MKINQLCLISRGIKRLTLVCVLLNSSLNYLSSQINPVFLDSLKLEKISDVGNILEIEFKETVPISTNTNNFYLTVEPKSKFGDFTLAVSSIDAYGKTYNWYEVDTSSFRIWKIKETLSENHFRYNIPNNKPFVMTEIAYGSFHKYFPKKYFVELLNKEQLEYNFEENAHKGTILFHVDSLLQYPIMVNNKIVMFSCVKIIQKTNTKYFHFWTQGLQMFSESTRIYWVLNNPSDPFIIKTEEVRRKCEKDLKNMNTSFSYLTTEKLVSIKTKN